MKKFSLIALFLFCCSIMVHAASERGDRGGEVEKIQRMLITQGYLVDTADGVFGNHTEYAVKAFQKDLKLPVTGKVDEKTLRSIEENHKKFKSKDMEKRSVDGMTIGARGSEVEDIQLRLANSGFSPGSIDGVFGHDTAYALKRFQEYHGFSPTGVVDAQTKAKLGEERGMPTSYKRVLTMNASAYTAYDPGNGNYTARGNLLRRGLVSVDPSVIPLGTELYIEGYGYAVADDTGGAIIGHKIDLAMESYDEAIQFGRRNVKVYIL